MSTITKEWLQQKIAAMESTRDEIPFGLDDDDSNTLAALRIALASLEAEKSILYRERNPYNGLTTGWQELTDDEYEFIRDNAGENAEFRTVYSAPPAPANAEPVAWLWSHRKHPREVTLVRPEDDEKAEAALWSGWSYQALYPAPPAPVSVPDELAGKSFNYIANKFQVSISEAQWILVGWNACRAAILQGAEPVTTAYKLPANTPCKDAPEYIWLQTAGVWPENGEFSELTWCSDNQHQDDTLYVRADVVAGNSPVIPDCSCRTCRPVTMTDMRFVVCPKCGNKRCPHANDNRNACTGSNEPGQEGSAYPAAPKQEA